VTTRRLRWWLFAGIAIVSGLGLVVELAGPEALVRHLSLSYEGNIPTWFSSSLLLGCALAAAAIAEHATSWRRHWWGMAVVLGYASMDEAAEIHEHLGGLIGTGGVLYFDWVIFAAALLAVLAIVYVRFFWRGLPRATRWRLIVGGAVYLVGAVGMELPLGWWTERAGNAGTTYAVLDWIEETLEMIGATLVLLALRQHREEAE
jgi:hypothetical protein